MSGTDFSKVDVEDMLDQMKARNVNIVDGRDGPEAQFSCPKPDHAFGDERPSARMNTITTAFHCHGCKWSGNAAVYVAFMQSTTELEARRWLRARYGGGFREPEGSFAQEVREYHDREADVIVARTPPSESWIETFYVDWNDDLQICEYMVDERGFNPSILDEWEVGHDILSDRITIPVRDENGVLVGFKGRAWRDEQQPKYLTLGDTARTSRYGFDTYAKSHYVFGMHKLVGDADPAIIVEGELNVIALAQKTHVLGFGVAGSEFSAFQTDLITSRSNRAIVFLDSDEAGDQGTSKIVNALQQHMPVLVAPIHDGDPASMTTAEITECIVSAENALLAGF
jgi:5S rRNA maturation endonuclease (ribonuclease M5)